HIRIGIHVGDVIYRDNDVFGDGVNIASRVQQLAESGGICLTEDVVRQVRNKIGVPLVSLGAGELKNIKLEVSLYKILLPWKQKKLSTVEQIGRVLKSRTFLWSAALLIILGVGLIFLTRTGYINFSPVGLSPNPEMQFSEINIPFKDIGPPGFSDDGNLMAFSAPDINGKYDVYLLYLSSMQYKRITFDSGDYASDVVLSRDGSLILDRKKSFSDSFQVSAISALGIGKKIALAKWAGLARISPDNQRVGYIVYYSDFAPEMKMFRTVRSDGTEDQQIFSDSLNGNFSFAWSPNGESIAWLRSFKEDTSRYDEIVLHNLSTGEEKQITNLKTHISEVEWTDDDLIYFTSPLSGKEYDLLVIPASGGKAIRLTNGSGVNDVIRFANKSKRMFIHKEDYKYFLTISDIDGANKRRITNDGLTYYDFYFESSDKISALRNNGSVNEVVRINTGSGEVEVLFSLKKSSGYFYDLRPVSPDLSLIAFAEIPRRDYYDRKLDSCMTYYCDKNYKNIRLIGRGIPEFWIDEKTLVFSQYSSNPFSIRRYIYDISTSSFVGFPDSKFPGIYPLINKNTLIITDTTGTTKFATFFSKDSLLSYLKNGGKENFIPFPKNTYFDFVSNVIMSRQFDFALSIPDLKKIPIGTNSKSMGLTLSQDLKNVAFPEIEFSSKVITIDNIVPK
ncbi:MAG: adenylate/guanylate cyclase domain-containing protein, partial [Ignavibacteria bacterium]